jgi:3-deoxy-manno-octulosonate cytidylyltransferase (CMP-KDO synthetase)
MSNKILGVIPARYDSTRLPGKPLADIHGKPMIQWVYERSLEAELSDLVVATDDRRIYDTVLSFGGKAVMTLSKHISGTLRVCEVANFAKYAGYNYFINIQGDQPLIEEYTIRMLAINLLSIPEDKDGVMTLVSAINDDEINNTSVAKVIVDKNGKALYFSRCPIPYQARKIDVSPECTSFLENRTPYLKHLGAYGFTRKALDSISKMSPSYLEQTEKLEQLTWLYEGIPVYTSFGADINKASVDTIEDLEKVRRIVSRWQKHAKK